MTDTREGVPGADPYGQQQDISTTPYVDGERDQKEVVMGENSANLPQPLYPGAMPEGQYVPGGPTTHTTTQRTPRHQVHITNPPQMTH